MDHELPLELSLERIKDISKHTRVENERFGRMLRRVPSVIVDHLVAQHVETVSALIDCTTCANCCKVPRPAVLPDEIPALALKKGLPVEHFIAQFTLSIPFITEAGEAEVVYYLTPKPCPNLSENLCSVYSERPASCADFPHLLKPHFKYRFTTILENASYCPIVFNVLRRLKACFNEM